MDAGVVWSAVGAVGSAAAAVVAAWAARQSRFSAQEANAAAGVLAVIESDRRHAELTPRFRVTVDDGGSGTEERLVMRMMLIGPPGLDHLDSLIVRIRDDNYRRWTGGELPVGATHEQVRKCIWGPYRLVPGLGSDDGRADETGRSAKYNTTLPIGEDVAFPVEVTRAPPWLGRSQQDWQRYWQENRLARTIRIVIEASLVGHRTWRLPYEVKLGPGRRGATDSP
jgi:hypothetical protein